MPLYEYQCDACGHRFEKIQKFSDPLEDTCPECGGILRKLASSPAIQFKGSGFYITDYAKKDYVAATKADSGASEKTEKSTTPEKSEKSAKSESSGQSGKSEKSEKSEKPAKAETSPSSGSSSSSGSTSTPSASSTTSASPKKD
jgi:putative FmdB family regulatory protein